LRQSIEPPSKSTSKIGAVAICVAALMLVELLAKWLAPQSQHLELFRALAHLRHDCVLGALAALYLAPYPNPYSSQLLELSLPDKRLSKRALARLWAPLVVMFLTRRAACCLGREPAPLRLRLLRLHKLVRPPRRKSPRPRK